MKRTHAFTLVELLVVIGIIGVLLSILLPALAGARDQANTTMCMSNMHQFYNLFMLYVDDYKGYVLPAVNQDGSGPEYDFYSFTLLGHELNKAGAGIVNGVPGNLANAAVIKQVFTCPSANHSQDPSYNDSTNAVYFGDYIYNIYMGQTKYTQPAGPAYAVNTIPKITQVPNNVILMTESCKPNDFGGPGTWNDTNLNSAGYKNYFGSGTELVNNNVNSPALVNKIGTPHAKGKKATFLSADGHVSYFDPYVDTGLLLPGVAPTPLTGSAMKTLNASLAGGAISEIRAYTYKFVIQNGTAVTFADYLIGPGPNDYTQSNGITVTTVGMHPGPAAIPAWDSKKIGLP